MERFICVACGTQYPDSDEPPAECPICVDERQYVPKDGQRWTTLAELASDHSNDFRDEGTLTGVGTEPGFAIGQRALLVPFGDANVMWDCITLLDDATAEEVERRGGHALDLGVRKRDEVGIAPHEPDVRAVGDHLDDVAHEQRAVAVQDRPAVEVPAAADQRETVVELEPLPLPEPDRGI